MIGDLDFFNQERERSYSSLTQIQHKDRTLSEVNAADRSTNVSSHQTEGGSFKLRLIPILGSCDDVDPQNKPTVSL